MPWVRFDDQYPINRKVEALSDAGFRLNHCAIHWSARELTDGRIKAAELDLAAPRRMRNPRRHVAELVAAGLWEETADGWAIHDYHDYQPTREQVIAERAATAERQRRWREKRKEARNAVTDGVTDASSNDSANATPSSRDTGDHNGVSNAAPSRPDPTRPAQDYVSTSATPSEPPPILDAELLDEPPPNLPAVADKPENAGTILAELLDRCAERNVTLPKRLKGQYAKAIKDAITEHFSPDLIRRALGGMLRDNVIDKPIYLTNRLVQEQTGAEVRRAPIRSTVDDRVAGWAEIAVQLEEA